MSPRTAIIQRYMRVEERKKKKEKKGDSWKTTANVLFFSRSARPRPLADCLSSCQQTTVGYILFLYPNTIILYRNWVYIEKSPFWSQTFDKRMMGETHRTSVLIKWPGQAKELERWKRDRPSSLAFSLYSFKDVVWPFPYFFSQKMRCSAGNAESADDEGHLYLYSSRCCRVRRAHIPLWPVRENRQTNHRRWYFSHATKKRSDADECFSDAPKTFFFSFFSSEREN